MTKKIILGPKLETTAYGGVMKKKGLVEPETFRWYLHENDHGVLVGMEFNAEFRLVGVRLIREKDYQKLLKLARKGHALKTR